MLTFLTLALAGAAALAGAFSMLLNANSALRFLLHAFSPEPAIAGFSSPKLTLLSLFLLIPIVSRYFLLLLLLIYSHCIISGFYPVIRSIIPQVC